MIEKARMDSIRSACAAVQDALAPQRFEAPALYVVATPIGNVADLSLRAIAVLLMADAIAAEDTRHAKPLLDRIGVRADYIACHEHNERAAAQRVLARLNEGARVAYVSDAGTPGISDPGARLVREVSGAGHAVVPIPGPSALATALSAAGVSNDEFYFAGFLPAKTEARSRTIASLARVSAAVVLYEAPHRIRATLVALTEGFGTERRCTIARELTKLHEDIASMPLGASLDWLDADANRSRGEFVLIIEGMPANADDHPDAAGYDAVLAPLVRTLPLRQAVALAQEITGAARNALYARALLLKDRAGDDDAD